jgi:hypothetical protein
VAAWGPPAKSDVVRGAGAPVCSLCIGAAWELLAVLLAPNSVDAVLGLSV